MHMATITADPVTLQAEYSRSLRIMARQQATPLEQTEIWRGTDEVSLVAEDPALVEEAMVVRAALATRRLLLTMPIGIEADELIVGTFRAKWFDQPNLPDFSTAEEKALYGIARNYGSYGHNAADYGTLIRDGLSGIRAKAQGGLERMATSDDPERERKAAFYRSIIVICGAVRDFAARYAERAEELAAGEADPERADELLKIASICRRVPEQPASSFQEALQSFVLYHIAIHAVHFDGALGRPDQAFYPLLQADLDNGVLSYAEAQELVDCFVLKINDCARHSTGGRFVRSGLFHNTVLAGQKADGSDATNEVSYMILDALRRLVTNFPTVSVRLHRRSPERLIRACCEVMRSNAGAPALYNDEIFVPALAKAGIPIEDARDYANDGCWETTVCGKTQFTYYTFSAAKSVEWVLTRGQGLPIDWKRALGWKSKETYSPVPASELQVRWPEDLDICGPEYWAMATDGFRSTGQRTYGQPIDTGDPCTFQTFEQFMEAVQRQIDYQVNKCMSDYMDRYATEAAAAFGSRGPTPLASALIQDCLEKGRPYGDGGERYTVCGIDSCALGNAADSLTAIEKLVYRERVLSMEQLIALLRSNFQGAEDMRSMFITRAPKYGNGDAVADGMLARLIILISDSIEKHALEFALPERYHLAWGMLAGTFEWANAHGASLGAMPDGRRASEPSSSNLGPSLGMAMKGPTAMLRSYASLPLERVRTGGPLDLQMDGTTLGGVVGLERLVGMVRSFVELGGNIMTITLADGETLRRAQKEPDKYRHLRVRLGGSQAYFVGLTPEQQNYYIARVERGLS
jgi:formate C-acetyltransferase